VLIDSSITDAAASISSALHRITEPLASRVILRDCGFLINSLRELASVKEPKWAD
jgi:hypothetical protein